MAMPWFKHYNNASTSLSIQKMMHELGVIGYAYYFLLLELLCSKFDGSSCVIDLTLHEVAVKLRIKSSRVQVILRSFSESNLLSSESLGVIIRINAPILLELKSKDFSRTRQERVDGADTTLLRYKNKNKIKNKSIIVDQEIDYTHPLEIPCDAPDKPKEPTLSDKCNVVAEIWNDIGGQLGLVKVKTPISKDRMEKMKTALIEFPSPQDWVRIVQSIEGDDFLMGKNDRGWKASFDWLFHKTKFNYRKLWEAHDSINWNND